MDVVALRMLVRVDLGYSSRSRRSAAGFERWKKNRPVHLRILDTDGSVSAQASLKDAAAWQSVATVPLRDLAPKLRLWSRTATMRAARERIPMSNGPTITLLGSGDFHHLAVLAMEQAVEPITIVHFDNHPDWVRLAPRWHCGSWVNRALALPHVRRVVTIGPCSDDLVRPEIKGGNLRALDEGRIALFPWHHAPSRVWGRHRDGAGHRYADGALHWRNLDERTAEENREMIMAQIETNAIWITIDKDVLSEAEALTNWDQGEMPLKAIVELIAAVGAKHRIVGADICGEYSPSLFSNAFKRWEAKMDQPDRTDVDQFRLAQNEAVNRTLLRAIVDASDHA